MSKDSYEVTQKRDSATLRLAQLKDGTDGEAT